MQMMTNALLAGALLLASAAVAGAATDRPESESAASQAAVLPALVAHRDYALARAVLRRIVAGTPTAALDMANLEALILEREGKYEAAIRQFRAILAKLPSYLPARVELAKALYVTGQSQAADHYFEAIEMGSQDTGLKRLAENFRTRIRAGRAYGVSGYVSILPSTNINKGTDNGTFMVGNTPFRISGRSRAQSGIGIGFGAEAYRAWHSGKRTTYTFSTALDLKKYSATDDNDQLTLTANPTVQHQFGTTLLRFGPLVQYEWLAWQPYLFRYGLAGTLARPFSQRTVAFATATLLKQDYSDQYDYQDGWRASGSANLRYFVSPAFSLTLSGVATAERTRRDDLDHNDYRVQIQADREWSGGFLTSLFVAGEKHDYLGDFPSTSIARRDTEIDVGGSIALRTIAFGGFAPQLTYRYTQQSSNISFYDYHSHDVGLTLTKNF